MMVLVECSDHVAACIDTVNALQNTPECDWPHFLSIINRPHKMEENLHEIFFLRQMIAEQIELIDHYVDEGRCRQC